MEISCDIRSVNNKITKLTKSQQMNLRKMKEFVEHKTLFEPTRAFNVLKT